MEYLRLRITRVEKCFSRNGQFMLITICVSIVQNFGLRLPCQTRGTKHLVKFSNFRKIPISL